MFHPSQLPLSLLKTAQNHPMLIELKNGETYNGMLVACDAWMNIHLRDAICTSKVIQFKFFYGIIINNNHPLDTWPSIVVRGVRQFKPPSQQATLHLFRASSLQSSCDLISVIVQVEQAGFLFIGYNITYEFYGRRYESIFAMLMDAKYNEKLRFLRVNWKIGRKQE